jgi:hypothetical protein
MMVLRCGEISLSDLSFLSGYLLLLGAQHTAHINPCKQHILVAYHFGYSMHFAIPVALLLLQR